jgi:hypothetical protein
MAYLFLTIQGIYRREQYYVLHGQVTRVLRHHAKQPCVHVMHYNTCLNIKHKINHFALRAKLFLKAAGLCRTENPAGCVMSVNQ